MNANWMACGDVNQKSIHTPKSLSNKYEMELNEFSWKGEQTDKKRQIILYTYTRVAPEQ